MHVQLNFPARWIVCSTGATGIEEIYAGEQDWLIFLRTPEEVWRVRPTLLITERPEPELHVGLRVHAWVRKQKSGVPMTPEF